MKENKDIKVYQLANEQHPNRFFRIERMEDHYDDVNGSIDDPHRHDFYVIIWVKEGEGKHTIDFETYDLKQDSLFFLSPGQIHQVETYNRPKGWAMSFSKDFLLMNDISLNFMNNINIFRQYSETPPLQASAALAAKLEFTISEMLVFFDSDNNPYKQEALGALLCLFLIYCNSECDFPEPLQSTTSCLLVDFRNKVEDEFKQNHKVNEYAEELHVTPKYLNEVVKGSLGYTAKEYITDRIIIEAKRLLLHSNLSAKEIAFELGFKEALHFSPFFKKATDQTPLEFRNTH